MLKEFINVITSSEKFQDDWKDIAQALCGNSPDDPWDCEFIDEVTSLGYKIKSVAGYGGEGCGDKYWGVFSLEKDGKQILVKIDGYYSSYDGPSIDSLDMHEVYAKEKTIIVYE